MGGVVVRKFQPQRLRELRSRLGIDQKRFAEKLGISQSLVSLIEAGKRTPDLEIVELAADILSIEVGYMFGEEPQEHCQQLVSLLSQLPPEEHDEIKEIILLKIKKRATRPVEA